MSGYRFDFITVDADKKFDFRKRIISDLRYYWFLLRSNGIYRFGDVACAGFNSIGYTQIILKYGVVYLCRI